VVTFHGYDATRLARSEYWQRKYREMWPHTAAVAGVSEHICTKLRQLGAPASKLHKMSNGVNPSKFQYSNPADRFDGKNVECLFVGRLVEKKAPLVLVRAFQAAAKLVAPTLHLALHVVGDGPLMPQLREYVTAQGMADLVHIHGALDHEDVRSLFARVHLYVQHSVTAEDGDQEGQPVSLIEASACGLPIVSTRHSGIADVVVGGMTGLLVEENDFESMGRKIAYLAAQPEKWGEMGLRGRKHVEQSMNLNLQAGLWKNLYRRISPKVRASENLYVAAAN